MIDSENESKPERYYARPPITEAVIELRFLSFLGKRDIERVRQKFGPNFFNVVGLKNIQVQVPSNAGNPQLVASVSGYRFISVDGTELFTVTEQAVAFSRLAPYNGWEEFSKIAFHWFNEFRKNFDAPSVARAGLRYVNRVDLPIKSQNEIVRLEDYFTIQPQYPEDKLPPLKNFTMQNIFDLRALDCVATVNLASVPSPLPMCLSIILDIDLGRDHSIPQRLSDVKMLLDEFRVEKNRIFEACLTEKTRELFK